jgi:AhpD family alkylhydroperoxidase
MGTYEDTLKDIETSFGIVPGFMKALPADALVHDWPLMKKYVLGASNIPAKYRELIGLAIAANLKCPYCQLFHTGVAKLHGASDEELAEIYFLASFSSRWSAIIHAQNYDYDTFEEEIHKIGAHLSK